MTAFRRLSSNFALQHAADQARHFGRPLVILEALRSDYPFASDRLHRFVINGMAEHARALADTPVTYFPYVEPAPGAGRGLLATLARHAVVVVTDDYPCFFLPRMVAAAAAGIDARLEVVDSNGLMPMRATGRTFVTAFSFRAHLQRELPAQLVEWPVPLDLSDLPAPPASLVDEAVTSRWRPTPLADLDRPDTLIASLPIDHAVRTAPMRGGSGPARAALRLFANERLARYADDHSHPDAHGTSGLSPWLHFGHLSAHEVFEAIMTAERWTSRKLTGSAGGARAGWWHASAGAEAFLDQLITWRELGFNMCATRPDDYASFDSLPAWAQTTLDAHASDPRQYLYTFDEFEQARTHDEVWNAAQRQLTRDGWMHNYLRMLWAKKILEWSSSPREALATMIALMDKHAVDGRDPNSYTGYCWTLGRYDRPWAPERPIFGTIRYMSSANTVKKLRMKNYLATYR
jgi:deoxyribodipyrimidine photo-lyase